ncbi:hypothetical protein [Methylophilus aquaticus]|uniref:Uncharacterized protein n=1 Tax=Methylophilus aquaticus TaxID=1971610 RepID=A0ABT9JQW5_9PROT|nr:hypothetical protein [Methylophilus aquaticus]MDP8566953.1 hypothetical protein [Methylophilus aquaticus]
MIEIGKLNIILIGVIGVIVVGLISTGAKDEDQANGDAPAEQATPKSVVEVKPAVPQQSAVSATVPVTTHLKTEAAEVAKKPKKNEAFAPVTTSEASLPEKAASSLPSGPVGSDQALQNNTSRNIIVFNIWSVSELRLRGAYTKIMNDSSVPQAQSDARKKDYLNFVNRRARLCGELDNTFTSNINTVEKLNFHERDIGILKCHTSENIAELDRLMLAHGFDS